MTNNLTRGVDVNKRICSVEGCGTVHYAKGFCNTHWQRWRRHGDAEFDSAQVKLARTEKLCRVCGETKPVSEFGRRRSSVDGLRSDCRACRAVDHAANRERDLARSARWAKRNPDRARVIWDRAYEKNASLYKDRARAWRLANPEKALSRSAWRRAAQKPVGSVDLDALWTGSCALCRETLNELTAWPDPMSKSVDHIIPLSRGGEHSQGNLQWTHLVCNLRKHATVPDEFLG